MIVEDHPATRESLVKKVSSDPALTVVAAVGTLQEALSQYANTRPDVVLVDLELPDGNGVDLIKQARAHSDALVISVFGDEERVVAAIGAGAKGYLLKDDAADEICVSIHRLIKGESPISPAIARYLFEYFQQRVPEETEVTLSNRELDVLNLAAKGYTYGEIAELINVSVHTVGTYTKRVYTKLEVNSRSAAVYEARRLGLMDD